MWLVLCLLFVFPVLLIFYQRWQSSQRLAGLPRRPVLITGCSSGFGFAAACRLDGLGVPVYATCRTEAAAVSLRTRCSDRLRVVMMNVTDSHSIRHAYYVIKQELHHSGLWGLVNNAGICDAGGPVEFAGRDNYERIYQVNVVGVTEVTRTFLPLLKKSSGRIVNVSSMAGRVAAPGMATYAASKFALEAYSDVLRREMYLYGIKVSVVEPGLYQTAINTKEKLTRELEQMWDRAPEDLRAEYGPQYLPENVKLLDGVQRLASDDLGEVVATFEHALFSVRPHARYTVGPFATVMRVLCHLPDAVVDALFRKASKRPLPLCLQQ